jgi:hypothetical protein
MDDLFELGGVIKNASEDRWEFKTNKVIQTNETAIISNMVVHSSRTSSTNTASSCQVMQTIVNESNSTQIHGNMNGDISAVCTSTTGESISMHLTEEPTTVHHDLSNSSVDPTLDEHDEEKDSKQQQRKRASRKKKRTKSNSNCNKKDLRVEWGQVEQLVFSRSFGLDAIPTHGMFPLGLGDFEERCCFTVDELFAQQQFKSFLASQQVDESPKSSVKQPTRSSPRIRKDSFDLTDSNSKGDNSKASAKDKSSAPRPKSEQERIELLKEFIDISQKHHGEPLHKELEEVRDSRENVGCSCKPLKLDKLNVSKLKSELLQRRHLIKNSSVDIEKLKKNELINFLRDVLKECPTCVVENCECVRDGIPCAGNACDCVYRPGESESCTNPFGSVTFDHDKVKAYRQRILEQVKSSSSS